MVLRNDVWLAEGIRCVLILAYDLFPFPFGDKNGLLRTGGGGGGRRKRGDDEDDEEKRER